MAQLYNPAVGAMLSRPNEEFNVIIDSLMKPQFLWWAAENGGPKRYATIARAHALTIARDFVRADGSTCHICYYDEVTGALVRREARESAYSVDSTWARGQAWAILGFAAAYRETGRRAAARRGACGDGLVPRQRPGRHGPVLGLRSAGHPLGAARLVGRGDRRVGVARSRRRRSRRGTA